MCLSLVLPEVFHITPITRNTFDLATLLFQMLIKVVCSMGKQKLFFFFFCLWLNKFCFVISRNTNEKPSIYFYNGGDEQETRRYYPVNSCLQEIAKNLLNASEGKRPWDGYITEGLKHLQARLEMNSSYD